jgi:hypothetical protein
MREWLNLVRCKEKIGAHEVVIETALCIRNTD